MSEANWHQRLVSHDLFMIPKNTNITITLTLAQWEQIEEAANSYRDMGPVDEGWKSEELSSAATAFEHALRDAERSTLANVADEGRR